MRLLCLYVLVLAPRAYAQDRLRPTRYYPLKEGTRWVYRSGTRTFTVRVVKHERVGKELCARLESHSGDKAHVEHLAVRGDGVYKLQADGKLIEPPLLLLRLPPRAGESWRVDSRIDGLPVKGTFTLKEVAVSVPAGKYRAMAVSSTDFEIANRKMPAAWWFAPDVGPVRQRVELSGFEVLLELESYTPP